MFANRTHHIWEWHIIRACYNFYFGAICITIVTSFYIFLANLLKWGIKMFGIKWSQSKVVSYCLWVVYFTDPISPDWPLKCWGARRWLGPCSSPRSPPTGTPPCRRSGGRWRRCGRCEAWRSGCATSACCRACRTSCRRIPWGAIWEKKKRKLFSELWWNINSMHMASLAL